MLFTEETIGDFLEKQVEKNPERDFMVYPDRNLRFTYKEFDERVNMLAKGLTYHWHWKGRPCWNMGSQRTRLADIHFCNSKIGAVLVTVNTSYKSHELNMCLKQSDMKAIAIIDGFRMLNYIRYII